MDILPWHFRTFRTFGLYYEDPKQLWLLKFLHKLFVTSLTIHFTVFLCITLLITSHQGIRAFTAGLFLSVTYIAASFKLVTFIIHRGKIDDLLCTFRLNICGIKNEAETEIFEKYQHMAKESFVVRMVTTLGCSVCFLIAALMNLSSKNWELPYNAYQVFNISSTVPYVIALVAQVTTVVSAVCIDVTLDATAWAFIILICNQLELLSHRIKFSDRLVSVKYYVEHHNLIFQMVKDVQSCFIGIIVASFLSALFTLCSTVYQFAQTNNTIFDYVSLMSYLACLVIQLYYFCYFGNELQTKNDTVTNAVFESEWLTMKPFEKKNFWFVMIMGRRELVVSYHRLCSLDIQTFIWMLQATYAAFTLLQQLSV